MPAAKYSILEGANQTFTAGKDLVIKASGELEDFVKLLIDDKEVSKDNYTKKSGSTIITLKSNYLSTLSSGDHKITVVFNDGTAETNLTISDNAKNPKTGDNFIIYFIAAFVSFIGICSTMFLRKKIHN